MQKEKQHKKEKKKKKKGNKEKTSLAFCTQTRKQQQKKKVKSETKKPIKQGAAFVSLCTTCIGIEEGSRGGGVKVNLKSNFLYYQSYSS